MNDFDVMRFLAIGQYVPTDSALHRLDPRVKLLAISLITVTMMAQKRIGIMALALIAILVFFQIARLSIKHALRSLIPLLPLFGFVLILQLLFYPHQQSINAGGAEVWRWKGIVISWASILSMGTMALRMVAIVLLLTLYTSLADISDLTHGVDGLLAPLQRLKFPAHELTLILIVAFRFIPMMGQEMERLLKAQAARGGEFTRGWGLKRARQTIPLFVPLFVAALRRAEELAVAMEARGYSGGHGRTRLVVLHMRAIDWLVLLVVIIVCTLTFVL